MYPQVFGKYVLERELARGGMARVLLATLRGAGGFEKKLVVKQIRDELALDEDFVRRFVEEAKTTVALSHPNIVPVYELGVERGTYFLAMELVEGVSVSELLRDDKKKTKLTPEQGAFIGVAICRALDYAHRRMQVVHRDITPRNVMIDEEGQIKLIDFGIAARAAASSAPGQEEKERRVFGSPGHMPPEQIAGKQLGPATDLFAVAVLLMEAWSGHAPFRRKNAEESEAAMRAPHPKPSDVDIRLLPLDEPIARAMSLDPAARQQDADELGRALRKFLQEVDLGDVARGLGDRARATRERDAKREQRSTLPEGESVPHKSDGDPATATFAARDEIKRLSEKPEAMEIGTRKLAFLTPAIPFKTNDVPVPDVPIETIATSPVETPVGQPSVRSPEKTSRSRVGLIAAGAAVVIGVGIWSQVHGALSTTSRPSDLPSAVTASATSSTPTPTASASTAVPPSSAPITTSAPSTSAAANVAPQNDAHLSLFGDPGTRVSIDGAARGACPLRDISISSGNHEVRFTFDPSGESRSQPVHLAAGGHATLRADFTGPTPMVHVEH